MIDQLKIIFKNYNITNTENYYIIENNKKTIYLYKNNKFNSVIANYYIHNPNRYWYNNNIGIIKYCKENKLHRIIFDIRLSYILPFLRKRKIKFLKKLLYI